MAKIDDNGRVTLPPEIRERFHLEPGTTVRVEPEDGRIVIEPERDPDEVLARMEELLEGFRSDERVDTVNERDPYAIHHREIVRRAAEDDA